MGGGGKGSLPVDLIIHHLFVSVMHHYNKHTGFLSVHLNFLTGWASSIPHGEQQGLEGIIQTEQVFLKGQ